jgi:hypothetical protein
MTAVTDVQNIIEALKGSPPTAQQISNISQHFIDADPTGLLQPLDMDGHPTYYADWQNPTNEEQAVLTLAGMKYALQEYIKALVKKKQQPIKDGIIQSEMDAAITDLD